MGDETLIQWTDHTFNAWRGCVKIAPECDNCYAEAERANRIHEVLWGSEKQGGVRAVTRDWQKPFHWDREAKKRGTRHKVFCASLGDVFENWKGPMSEVKISPDGVSRETLIRDRHPPNQTPIWYGSTSIPQADVALYLKDRPGLQLVTMADARRRFFSHVVDGTPNLIWQVLTKRPHNIARLMPTDRMNKIPVRENLWLGTSVGSEGSARKMISHLIRSDLSAKRFLSCEPLLERLDLSEYLATKRIDWVIVGGESGRNARRCDVEWIQAITLQCEAHGVACFVKQLGARPFWKGQPLDLQHKKGGDATEWPFAFPTEFPSY